MKKIIVRGADNVQVAPDHLSMHKSVLIEGDDRMVVDDGYHTFDELYAHRIALFIALCQQLLNRNIVCEELGEDRVVIWRSKKHSDGGSYDGWFIMGINTEKEKQISYHLPMSKWDETAFAHELETAPEWDGHTSDDVLNRLKNI